MCSSRYLFPTGKISCIQLGHEKVKHHLRECQPQRKLNCDIFYMCNNSSILTCGYSARGLDLEYVILNRKLIFEWGNKIYKSVLLRHVWLTLSAENLGNDCYSNPRVVVPTHCARDDLSRFPHLILVNMMIDSRHHDHTNLQ